MNVLQRNTVFVPACREGHADNGTNDEYDRNATYADHDALPPLRAMRLQHSACKHAAADVIGVQPKRRDLRAAVPSADLHRYYIINAFSQTEPLMVSLLRKHSLHNVVL